jgi:hypothetical protein
MTLTKKLLGLSWFALCIVFIWAFTDLGKTYGGVRYLLHVGAGAGAAAALASLAASAVIGFGLFVRLKPNRSLTLAAGCVAGYVLAGVFTGIESLQLLMPPMMGRPLIWAYLVTAALASFTLFVGFIRSSNRS